MLMKIDTNSLLPNTVHMVRVAATFVILAILFGVIFGEYLANELFPILAYVVWGLGFIVIFAIVYVMWLIYYAINAYKTQEQKQRTKAFQLSLDGKQADKEPPRRGRNPKRGEKVNIPEKKSLCS